MPISVNSQVGQQPVDTPRVTEGARTSGSFLGRSVSVPTNMSSMVADAAEELTFGMSEIEEQSIAKRTPVKQQRSRLIDAVKAYQELIDKEEFAQEARKLNLFISQMMQKASGGFQSLEDSFEQIDKYLGKTGSDITEQYALLAEAFQNVPPDSEEAEAILFVLEQMENRQGDAIAAGIHASIEADNYAELGEPQKLRSTYRSVLLEFENSRAVFDWLLEQYGADKIDLGFDFLFATFAHDAGSACPSSDKARMELFSLNVNNARDTASVYGLSGRLLDRLESEHGVALPEAVEGNNVTQTMNRFLQMLEQAFPAPMDVNAIVDPLGIPDVTRQVLFLQDTLKETKMLPVKVFDSLESRDKVLQLIQQELDNAIEREDEELGY
ncbi:type III secretion system gatekeeper subunit SctW [Halodesulfovibrio marinisediminis]|uniref:Type III secretion regulator YopN/LcrE/InvE/MxiC n=1 Tax=Halodesulfovibrio marinisediminis DSM 17456 TaxID=1121457 RepID=A0A1N6I8Q4_9BACT|nr:type III secretion system gatekeeper subunit SctW [Halodesulfovibrio marinisediminis]SIO28401.1 type III secretion regulator YopN/LcrE/InvE/MxiC [Halodesulfovibrio marinisediminis DSM 17456]